MKRETDNTYPNPPDDIPANVQNQPSPLMQQAKDAFGMGPFQLPWTRKPLGKPTKGVKQGNTKGHNKIRTVRTRSGVHKLGKKHAYGFY